MSLRVRIGVIGAGTVFGEHQLSSLAVVPGVELVAIANDSHQNPGRVAHDFGFQNIEHDWRELIHRPDVEAVVVGTWPSLQKEVLLCALRAGLHVFCQGPLALNLREAKELVVEAKLRTRQVAILPPSPLRISSGAFVRHLLESGAIGPITAVDLLNSSATHADRGRVAWQEREEACGNRALGTWQMTETLNNWVGPYRLLSAVATTPVPAKRDATGQEVRILTPQVIMIAGLLANGEASVEYHSTIVADRRTPRALLTVHGLEGTLRYDFDTSTLAVARTNQALDVVEIPPAMHFARPPEATFVDAIQAAMQGQHWSKGDCIDFVDALACMRKIEAIHVSAATGSAVELSTL